MQAIIQVEHALKIDNIIRNGLFCACTLLVAMYMQLLVSCKTNKVDDVAVVGDTLDIRHASLLQIIECDGYTAVDVKNPWNGKLMQRYLLVPKDSALPDVMPRGTLLRTPLDNILVFSTVHAELLDKLGCADAITGVCDARYITLPRVRQGVERGDIIDCGSSLDINVERVVQLSPCAAWVMPFENGGYGKLDKLHLPIVECAEYMENSPLGGAEWVRFFGRVMGCAATADSIFSVVERNYQSLCDSISKCTTQPSLMCELKGSSAWYMPAGNSTMGRLYRDAGANYLFAYNEGNGSVPLAFETVLERASDADVWLVKYGADCDKTYKSLAADFAGYEYFDAYKNRNIYACNVNCKRFYEETPFRPDILLRELAAIFHPELFPDYQLRYYEKMQE